MTGPLIFILAGGEGVRLRPLTEHRCKPAIPFGGRYRLIDIPISNALKPNWNKVYVLTQFLSESLSSYISHAYGDKVTVLSSKDEPYQGTADCIRKHLSLIENSNSEHIVILSGDQLYAMDLDEMWMSAKMTGADLTIATLPINEEEATRMGVMKINENKMITDFIEKPKTEALLNEFSLSRKQTTKIHSVDERIFLGSMGIYIFKKQALISLLNESVGTDFGMHIIPHEQLKGKTFAYIFDGYWEDIGTIKSYYKANLKLLENTTLFNIFFDKDSTLITAGLYLPPAKIDSCYIENSIISDGCIISAKEITFSLLGLNTDVGKGSVLSGVVSLGALSCNKKTTIGKDCFLEKVIIDESAIIEDNVHLSLNGEQLSDVDLGPIVIKDGIIVVKKGAVISKSFSLIEKKIRLSA